MKSLLTGLRALAGVEAASGRWSERLVSMVGGFIAVFLVFVLSQRFVAAPDAPLIVASMGASAVLLFAVPHGPLSQPWPLLGGQTLSALTGVICAKLLPDPQFAPLAAAGAVALSIALMQFLRCLHPPGGATALTAVISGENVRALGYGYVLTPVLLNALILLGVAVLINGLFPWRRYPAALGRAIPAGRAGLSQQDLEYALREVNSFVDIDVHDLVRIYTLAAHHRAHHHAHTPPLLELVAGRHYSNGKHGPDWAVRRITRLDNEKVSYQTVAGPQRRHHAQCSLDEFIRWADHEVFRNENSWQKKI